MIKTMIVTDAAAMISLIASLIRQLIRDTSSHGFNMINYNCWYLWSATPTDLVIMVTDADDVTTDLGNNNSLGQR